MQAGTARPTNEGEESTNATTSEPLVEVIYLGLFMCLEFIQDKRSDCSEREHTAVFIPRGRTYPELTSLSSPIDIEWLTNI